MPDDCGLKPPIETLPQIAHARAMNVPWCEAESRPRPIGRQRGGMIAHGLRRPAGHGRGLDAGPRRPVDPQLEVDAVPNRRAPGRSYVTRRAVVDVVRMAVLGSYGVTGISDPSFGRRLLRWSGLGQSGIRVSLDRTIAIEVDLTIG